MSDQIIHREPTDAEHEQYEWIDIRHGVTKRTICPTEKV